MKYTLTGEQAKQTDDYTIHEIGIPSVVLMERASLAVADAVSELAASGAVILVLCGMGNNGADGIAAARILKQRGFVSRVIPVGDPARATEEWKLQRSIAEKLQVPFIDTPETAEKLLITRKADVIIDALFGIGLAREISGDYAELIRMISRCQEAKVVAVDIPSGIHSTTGAVMGTALKADITVTFGYRKTGMTLYPGRAYCGEIRVAEIGFAQALSRDACLLEPADLNKVPVRRADGNKGTFGKLLLIAGSEGMSGAAYLSALAAYRCGAGLVKILTVESNRIILQSLIPEAVVIAYEPKRIEAFTEHPEDGERDTEDYLSEERRLESRETFQDFIKKQCDWADAIVMGPGLGQEPYAVTLVETVLEHAYVPTVADADALNIMARQSYLNRYLTENIIITPHVGEMARLTGLSIADIKTDPVRIARDYSARTAAVCVLKDAATVTADKDGHTYINTSGTSAMAKGGAGDVLAGLIGALLCQGMENIDAAAYGVYLHGLAGEAAEREKGGYGVLARDIADHIRPRGTE